MKAYTCPRCDGGGFDPILREDLGRNMTDAQPCALCDGNKFVPLVMFSAYTLGPKTAMSAISIARDNLDAMLDLVDEIETAVVSVEETEVPF